MSTFQLNGETFDEGRTLFITTPELGTIKAIATIQSFSHDLVLGLDLGWIKTPQPCRANITDGTNARLSFYTNGKGYTNLRCAYLCSCGHNAHPRYFEWGNLHISGNTITAGPAPVPIALPRPTLIAKPTPPPPAPKKPKGKDNSNGQLSFF